MTGADAAPPHVAGSFTFGAQLPNGKTLNVSGYIIAGDTDVEVNARLDQVARAVERQRMIAEIPELEAKVQQYKDAREQMEEILSAAADKSHPTSRDRETVESTRRNLKLIESNIEKGTAAVERAKAAIQT